MSDAPEPSTISPRVLASAPALQTSLVAATPFPHVNPEWDAAWGGCLELFRDPHADAQSAASIAPAFNRCVIFETSGRSWHAFNRIELPPEQASLSRRSIALYFYTKDRPAAETAPRHTTYYVNRQLPEHLDAGHVLTPDETTEIRRLIAQHDAHQHAVCREHGPAQGAGQRACRPVAVLAKRAFVRFRK